MIIQISETKKTLLLLIVSIVLFIFVMFFFIDFSKSIENGLKRFLNNISYEYKYSNYNTFEKSKKQNILKKEQEMKNMELNEVKIEDHFDFKIERFEKNKLFD